MSMPLTIECDFHIDRGARGRKGLGAGPPAPGATTTGRVPRVARLLALANRFEGLIRAGQVEGYAELARLGHVTPARVSQVMTLLHLAPDIQEAVLFLPRTVRGRDPIQLRHLQPIASVLDWRKQRKLWS